MMFDIAGWKKYSLGFVAGLGLLVCAEGCSSYEIRNFDLLFKSGVANNVKDKDQLKGKNLEDLLKEKFTEDAFEILKDIPLKHGYVKGNYAGYAAGINGWSMIGSLLSGNGFWGRKVIVKVKNIENVDEIKSIIAHEYSHHLIDIGCIDPILFNSAYSEMCKDPRYKNLIDEIENDISNMSNARLFFGVNKQDEIMTIFAEKLAMGEIIPGYMKDVYKRWIRID